MALIRYCLDTSAYSNFRRGDPKVVDLIDQADWIGISSIALGELWLGFLLGGRLAANQAALAEFLAHPIVEELPVDHKVSRIYAEIVASLREAGKPVPSNDIWIAANAARADAVVLTYDDHFEHIQHVPSIILPLPHPAPRQRGRGSRSGKPGR